MNKTQGLSTTCFPHFFCLICIYSYTPLHSPADCPLESALYALYFYREQLWSSVMGGLEFCIRIISELKASSISEIFSDDRRSIGMDQTRSACAATGYAVSRLSLAKSEIIVISGITVLLCSLKRDQKCPRTLLSWNCNLLTN
jgi:hypothetical protein